LRVVTDAKALKLDRSMRLGLAQINPTVGDLAGNRRLILEAYTALVAQGAELVVFPELATCGYPWVRTRRGGFARGDRGGRG
jgi:predicted amidohydrolase